MKYLCDPHVIPTVVPKDISEIGSYADSIASFADTLHVDVGDGRFESNVTWPFVSPGQQEEVDAFRSLVSTSAHVSFETHLMVEDPKELGVRMARAGFRRITAHREVFGSAEEARAALDAFREAGAAEAGLALKIETPLSALDTVVGSCDFVHLMSIAVIGSQGYAFDERALSRVEELHARYPDLMVAVDGGVTEATVEELVRAGANRLMVGHVLAESAQPAKEFARIHERAMKGCAPLQSEEMRTAA